MRKIILISFFVYLLFVIEFFLFNLMGRSFVPDLLLLFVIFCSLSFGVRYSIYAALLGGLLLDSFSTSAFGINVFSFVLCAYLTALLKNYIYHGGSHFARFILIFVIVCINIIVQFFLHMMFGVLDIAATLQYVFLPQAASTLLVSSIVFYYFKKCASKLFV